MGAPITLTAKDGHSLEAYRADPTASPRGGILVIQEIYGVNAHIRAICDDFAGEGFVAIAPALFDRVQRGVDLGYDPEATRTAVGVVTKLKPSDVLLDLEATIETLAKAGKVGVVGYCYGGTMAWAASCRLAKVAAASCYYGGQIIRQNDQTPKAPPILHFGERDTMIPAADVEAIRAAHPCVPIHVYPAGHGFNCDARSSYDAASAELAKRRTLELFTEHVG